MSATKFRRYAEVPADVAGARFVPVRSIKGILERAVIASLTDKTPGEQEDAGLEFGFYNDENSVTSLVLKWRDAGRLQVYRSTGGPITQGDVADGELRLEDLRALLAEEFDTGLVLRTDDVALVTNAVLKEIGNTHAKRWTPSRLEELHAYRKAHGTKKAAEWAGVSAARVRALLPGDKPQHKGYSAFNQRPK